MALTLTVPGLFLLTITLVPLATTSYSVYNKVSLLYFLMTYYFQQALLVEILPRLFTGCMKVHCFVQRLQEFAQWVKIAHKVLASTFLVDPLVICNFKRSLALFRRLKILHKRTPNECYIVMYVIKIERKTALSKRQLAPHFDNLHCDVMLHELKYFHNFELYLRPISLTDVTSVRS